MSTEASKAQQEVWEWKEKAYESIKDIPEKDRVARILDRVKDTIAQIKENQSRSHGETV